MDDDYTILAAPVPDPPPGPVAEDAAGGDVLPFAPPARDEPAALLLRGYDSPGDYFQPRLRSNDAA